MRDKWRERGREWRGESGEERREWRGEERVERREWRGEERREWSWEQNNLRRWRKRG